MKPFADIDEMPGCLNCCAGIQSLSVPENGLGSMPLVYNKASWTSPCCMTLMGSSSALMQWEWMCLLDEGKPMAASSAGRGQRWEVIILLGWRSVFKPLCIASRDPILHHYAFLWVFNLGCMCSKINCFLYQFLLTSFCLQTATHCSGVERLIGFLIPDVQNTYNGRRAQIHGRAEMVLCCSLSRERVITARQCLFKVLIVRRMPQMALF